jgi:ferredoxin
MLQYAVPEERLPRGVLDAEAALITRLGAELRLGTRVGAVVDLFGSFDAVLIAAGELRPGDAARFGVPASEQGVEADRHTLATPVPGVFAAGSAIRPQKMAVRSVADGKVAAASISQFLATEKYARLIFGHRLYSTHIGKLKEGEMAAFLAAASQAPRVEPSGGLAAGFTDAEARDEALRCLHCDCRKPAACRLRRWSDALDASPSRFKADRRAFVQHSTDDRRQTTDDRRHGTDASPNAPAPPPDTAAFTLSSVLCPLPSLIYEPGKCIRCGLCIQIAAKAGEALGLTFIGRGFDVVVGVPFNQTIADGLKKSAAECAAACPTGALALRQGEDPPGTT